MKRMVVVTAVTIAFSLCSIGCGFADGFVGFAVRGTVIDSETQEPLAGAAIGFRSLADGEEIAYSPVFFPEDGEVPNNRLVAEDGSFRGLLVERLWGATIILFIPFGADFTPATVPDHVEIIVTRDGCEVVTLIPVNEDTVDDELLGSNTIEFREPVLVDPCDQ